MKIGKWLCGPAALALVFGVAGGVSAKDNDAKSPVRLAQAEKKKAARTTKPRGLTAKQIADLEKLSGKTLTDDQKQQLTAANAERNAAIRAANEKFHEQKAKILGLTPEELKAKEKEAAAKARAEKKAKGAGG
ncbi:MAG TPA: hypothetical protein VNA16_01900 [Abditibacteriaceae bacterium]|nr:hypothetical protein [Abditibacteriaceae bacterium]